MAYTSDALHVTRWIGICPNGRTYDGPAPIGMLSLEHSCDSWEIGAGAEPKRLIADLRAALKLAKRYRAEWKQDPVLSRAARERWHYYCALCEIGWPSSAWPAPWEHRKERHGPEALFGHDPCTYIRPDVLAARAAERAAEEARYKDRPRAITEAFMGTGTWM